jgi:hypothetical protein
VGATGNPTVTVEREAATRHNHVHVRMICES